MRIDLRETAEYLLENDDYVFLCHTSPDGDTVGSAVALAYGLRSKGKRIIIRCGDEFAKDYDFMFADYEEPDFEPKRVVTIDVADNKLLGEKYDALYGGRVDLCIDHHASNILYAQRVCLEADSASTAEMIFILLGLMNIEITPIIASCLFTGVTTDTGCFRYSNTTQRTYDIAAKLVGLGADSYNIIQVFFETKTKTYAALERLALDTMRFYFSDRCALICVTRDMFEKTGSDDSETVKLANIPRQIEGVLVGVVMRELEDGSFKASVRTHGDIDASAICKRLGGGGHAGAAACVIKAEKQQAINMLLKEVEAEIDTHNIY
ncbi:MAG: bifunctional oligoribonuclease/PAP phosphatase NrnA [Clostridia bacterium]|nr:bifunctional oligoribonuclease/PAP phosphatase NrnA [Clostridia bacterium]